VSTEHRTRRESDERPLWPPTHTFTGERIPPVHKPYTRKGCVWQHGIGWVWNPTRRPFIA
jgi:hypothetical protein